MGGASPPQLIAYLKMTVATNTMTIESIAYHIADHPDYTLQYTTELLSMLNQQQINTIASLIADEADD